MRRYLFSRLNLFIFGVFLIVAIPQAQSQKVENVVYLKNGSIIRGKLLESDNQAKIRIETQCRSVWVFDTLEIERVAEEMILRSTNRSSGMEIEMGVGTYGMNIEDNKPVFSSLLSVGYLNKYRIYTGLGFGLELNVTEMFPVYIDAKYLLFDRQRTPVLSFRGGYNFGSKSGDTEIEGGRFYQLTFGLRRDFPDGVATYLSIGYRYQYMAVHETNEWQPNYEYITKYQINRIVFRVGLVF